MHFVDGHRRRNTRQRDQLGQERVGVPVRLVEAEAISGRFLLGGDGVGAHEFVVRVRTDGLEHELDDRAVRPQLIRQLDCECSQLVGLSLQTFGPVVVIESLRGFDALLGHLKFGDDLVVVLGLVLIKDDVHGLASGPLLAKVVERDWSTCVLIDRRFRPRHGYAGTVALSVGMAVTAKVTTYFAASFAAVH